jgi:AraC-like DNA-binding protein
VPWAVGNVTVSIRRAEDDDHDRVVTGACRDTTVVTADAAHAVMAEQVLASALEQLRLEGAIFFRSELSEPFAFESSPLAMADALHPGADRLILFHIVATGSCWVEALDGERHRALDGDVIVLPYGDRHVISGGTATDRVPIQDLLDPLPWSDLPLLRHGGGGTRTELVCGYLYSPDPLFDPALRAFPPAFVVRLPDGAASGWVRASVTYALEHAVPSNASPAAARLPELVLIEVLRAHLANAPAAEHGWLAALGDPVLAPALSLLHAAPERKWSVADLAAGAAVSRSLLDERFRSTLGLSPIRYLTEWRMHLAEELLATTDITIAAIARRVGYDSEEAFSRAFKRHRGLAPTHWRSTRRGLRGS